MNSILKRGTKRQRFSRAWNKHDLQKANGCYYNFQGYESGAVLLEDGVEHHGSLGIFTHLDQSYPNAKAMGHVTLQRVPGSTRSVEAGEELVAVMAEHGVRSAHLSKLHGVFTFELVDYMFYVDGENIPGRSAEIWWEDGRGEEWLLFDAILEEKGK